MRDFGEYLRAYWAYVLANLGWGKALSIALVAGRDVCTTRRKDVARAAELGGMIVWAVLGYIFAPYGMWKHHRAQLADVSQPDRK